jgi:hypothetical protein
MKNQYKSIIFWLYQDYNIAVTFDSSSTFDKSKENTE